MEISDLVILIEHKIKNLVITRHYDHITRFLREQNGEFHWVNGIPLVTIGVPLIWMGDN